MTSISSLARVVAGASPRLQRQVLYWAITVGLYAVCVAVLVFEVASGMAAARPVAWLVAAIAIGVLAFYVPVRASGLLRLPPSALAIAQAVYAIGCIVAAYALIGPDRGCTLAILLVVLVFCAFALTPRQARSMSVFAILLLGTAMLVMNRLEPQRYGAPQELVHFALATCMLAAVAFLTGELTLLRQRLKAQKTELAEALARIQEMATRDDLTLLANRRHMNELLAYEKQRHDRKGRTLCLALLDIDWFKRVNDTHGHAAGDQVLRDFARQAQSAVRGADTLARWGGEEFLLMLPDTELHAARQVLARIQAEISALRPVVRDAALQITFSAGLTASRPEERIASAIERADRAMYAAKAGGRNRIVVD
jgi:diguanylate cyclase (GGDEF)-like protein